MLDDPSPLELDLDGLYARYLVTCAMSGVEPVPRERASEPELTERLRADGARGEHA